jgi:hypothetical protein
MRTLLIAASLAAGLASSACLDIVTTVRANADGSGTIVARMTYTREGQQRLQSVAPLLGGGGGASLPKFTEADAMAAAERFGPGVTYVSSTPIKTDDGEGIEAIYAFKDINPLTLGAAPAQMPMPDASMAGPPVKFTLTRDSNGTALLRIQPPPPDFSAAKALQGSDPQSPLDPNLMAMVRGLVKGAHIAVFVEPVGTIVKTNAPYVDGPRIVLLDVQIDQLLTEGALARLGALKSTDDLKAFVKDTPGVKIALEPEISVEFKPQ